MKNIKKNFIKISFVLVIIITIFSSVLLPKNVSAEESWYYTKIDFSGKKIYSEEFTSKEKCLISKKEIHPSWEPSKDCYSEKEMIPTPLKEKEDVVQEKTAPTDNWVMLPQTKTTPEEQLNQRLENIKNPTNVINKGVEDASVEISPQPGTNIENKSTYTLLAPFLGLKCIDTSGTNPDCAKGGIGDYLNLIFNIAIALCGALAVIMIIIGGIEYMGEESVFGKTKARARITSALLGLVIALGSYAILNTINPDLLGKKGINLESVDITLDPEVHGDTPHSPINGKYCNGKYTAGMIWGSDETERVKLKEAKISVNKDNCKKVGDSNCTSITGLDTSKVIALKNTCGDSCEVMVTGGTECWLHSNKTEHLPGNSIVDLRTSGVQNYIETNSTKTKDKKSGYSIYIKNNSQFMKESDHYHIIKW